MLLAPLTGMVRGSGRLQRFRAGVSRAAGFVAACLFSASPAWADGAAAAPASPHASLQWLDNYCTRCHDDEYVSGGLSFTGIDPAEPSAGRNLEVWEKILRMTRGGQMPPRDREQPSPQQRGAFTDWLEGSLDAHAAAHPDPGRATLRRLNRSEYANAVRDLLALEVDVQDQLPGDDSGYGFDNIADVLAMSTTLMDRYLAVAGRVSRLAVGRAPLDVRVTSHVIPKDGSILNQGIPSWDERASEWLPLDSRGGAAFDFHAPYDAEYEISGWLNANTNNEVDRLPENRVSLRVPLKAGPHRLGITFRRQLRLDERVQVDHNDIDFVPMPMRPPEQLPLLFVVDGHVVGETAVPSYHMSPRFSQVNWPRDVLQIDVAGPYSPRGAGDTPSRRLIFQCRPKRPAADAACAREIVGTLASRAWRRPVTGGDIAPLLQVYQDTRDEAGFEAGIEAAVEALLVSPQFLFLVEQTPSGAPPGSVHPLGDLELASRLALFLWSSLPDDELLKLAARGRLRDPGTLQAQVDRMLTDPRAAALTRNFAGQWLYLRNLEHHRPDVFLFPGFNTRLRAAMRRETELFFANVVRENRSVLEFVDSDYTFLNEPLAQHYGIEGVKGPAFRRVRLPAGADRGGLLGQASILTVTSYGNHTSVVKRGQWILANLLAAPPPPPPPDVPALQAKVGGRTLSAREQLELHRENAACASCHDKIDPLGYALENFDAIGAFRSSDGGQPLDVTATLADGTQFQGLPGLRQVLLSRRDEFTQAFTERLMTYALGRGLTASDMPAVRAIARDAAADGYRIRAVILGIVGSVPFSMRKVPET